MNFTANITRIEHLVNPADIKTLPLSAMEIFLHLYGYLIIGLMLMLINTPVFVVVMMRKALRASYLILAIVFLNNALTGMSATLVGVKRLIISASEEQYISHYDCVFDLPFFLLATFFLNGWSLLMNSAERLCVVAYPLYYYAHNKQVVYSLIAIQYIITIIALSSTAWASFTDPIRYISHLCFLRRTYNAYFYAALILLSSTAAIFSIILMVIVVMMLKRKFGTEFISKHSHNSELTHFLNNQKRYTHTALISCFFTFLFYVAPSIMKCVYVLDPTKRSQIIAMISTYLTLSNSFNMVILFLYRQEDVRNAAVHVFRKLFRRKKHNIHPTNVVGFGE
ncbi:putative integral membrane protein [Acanthocheilonema viteae]